MCDNRMTTSNGNYQQDYKTASDFYKDEAVSGIYDRSARIYTSPEQDDQMKNEGNGICNDPYHLPTNNCGDLTNDVAAAGNVNLWSKFLAFGSPTIPNDQYKAAQRLAEQSHQNVSYTDMNHNSMEGEDF